MIVAGTSKSPGNGSQRDEVVAGGHVVAQRVSDPAGDEAAGLKPLDQRAKLLGLLRVMLMGVSKPDEADVSVIRQELLDLRDAFSSR